MAQADIDTTTLEGVKTTRRGMAGHVAGLYLASAAIAGVTAFADPVFAVLQEHTLMLDEVGACAQRTDAAIQLFGRQSAERHDAERLQVEVSNREADFLHEVLISTVPTTLAGLIAYVEYINSPRGFDECEIDLVQDVVFATILSALRRIAQNA